VPDAATHHSGIWEMSSLCAAAAATLRSCAECLLLNVSSGLGLLKGSHGSWHSPTWALASLLNDCTSQWQINTQLHTLACASDTHAPAEAAHAALTMLLLTCARKLTKSMHGCCVLPGPLVDKQQAPSKH
jgi:hypothetical protein